MSILDTKVIEQAINRDEATELLGDLLGRTERVPGYLELRAFPEPKDETKFGKKHWLQPSTASAKDLEAAVAWCEERALEGYAVYVGFNPRNSTESGKTKEHIDKPVALYTDLDIYKTDKTPEELYAKIAEMKPLYKPTYVINSGGGIQLVWVGEPQETAEWEERQEFLYQAFKEFGADRAVVTDTARVLRLPGFPNLKKSEPRKTSIISVNVGVDATPVKGLLTELERIKPTVAGEVIKSREQKAQKKGLSLPDEMPEGGIAEYEGRNDFLFRRACKLRNEGYLRGEIEGFLERTNQLRCNPPVSNDELQTIINQAMTFKPSRDVNAEEIALVNAEHDDEIDLFLTLDEFEELEIEPLKPVIYGLNKGEVGMIQAKPNIGKTTLVLNLAMSLACGRPFEPLTAPGFCTPMKVMYVDKENVQAFAKDDFRLMRRSNFDTEDQRLIGRNLKASVDMKVGDDEVCLSNPVHLKILERNIKKFGTELIIIDTLAAAFNLTNENDNSEMEAKVNKPLKELARNTGVAILLVHHIGKANENGEISKLYRGRGASSLAAMCRLVLDLDAFRDSNRHQIGNAVVLNCAKIKGHRFEDVTFEQDQNKRWFTTTQIEVRQYDETMKQLLELVTQPMSRTEIVEAMKTFEVSPSTTDRTLRRALVEGYLDKSKHGTYSPKSAEEEAPQSEDE